MSCKFENCEVCFDLYRGDTNISAVAKLNFVCILSNGFSLPNFLKIGCFKCCPYPAICLFSSSKLVGCSEPLEGILIPMAYLAPLLSLFLRNGGKESDTIGAYQNKKSNVSFFCLGPFFVLANSIHPPSHSDGVYSL